MAGTWIILLIFGFPLTCKVAFKSRFCPKVLRITKGMRNGFFTTPNVGVSMLVSSRSGNGTSRPTPTVNTGISFMRNRVAASTGDFPVFQSPSESTTTPRRLEWFSRTCDSPAFRSVASVAGVNCEENGSNTTLSSLSIGFHIVSEISGLMVSARLFGWPEMSSLSMISRVAMLFDLSQSTTSVGD